MIIVGVGAGPGMLTQEAIKAIGEAGLIYGSQRAVDIASDLFRTDSIIRIIEDYKQLRVLPEEARFACPETGHGVIPWAGGTQRLPRIVGRGRALEMILTGEAVDAQEALRIGLVSQVLPRGRLLAGAEALAGRIADRGPIAVRYAKEAVSRGLDMTLEQALRYETDLTIILQTTEDRAEGVRAFLEKRTPRFKGT